MNPLYFIYSNARKHLESLDIRDGYNAGIKNIMPVNKNALIRYKTIDKCLRNRYKRWTLDDIVDAVSDALYDMEGIPCVSVRTVQNDIQIMRSDKLGYNAPIVVYDNKYYKYADPNYSITDMPLSDDDCELIKKAVKMLKNSDLSGTTNDITDILEKVENRLTKILTFV